MHPIFFLLLSSSSLLFVRWLPQCCVDTGVLIYIIIHSFIIVDRDIWWCFPISSKQFQDLVVISINLFLTGISFSFSDRRHRIHPHGVAFFSVLLLAFNLINNVGVIFRSDYSGFICWSIIAHNQPIWFILGFWGGDKIHPHLLWVNCMFFGMVMTCFACMA